MKQLSIQELNSRLNLETFRQQIVKDDFWLTKYAEKEWKNWLDRSNKDLEKRLTKTSEELAKNIAYDTANGEFAEAQLASYSEEYKAELKIKYDNTIKCLFSDKRTEMFEICHKIDFDFFVLLSYCAKEFCIHNEYDMIGYANRLLNLCNVDIPFITKETLVELCTPYFASGVNKLGFIDGLNIDEIINQDLHWIQAEGTHDVCLEPFSNIVNGSYRGLIDEDVFIYLYCFYLLQGIENRVKKYGTLEEFYSSFEKGKVNQIILDTDYSANYSSQKIDWNQILKQSIELLGTRTGRIIIIDKHDILLSNDNLSFRKSIVDKNLLEYFIRYGFSSSIYILNTNQDPLCVKHMNFIVGKKHSRSMFDSGISLHKCVTPVQIMSLGYDFTNIAQITGTMSGDTKYHSIGDIFSAYEGNAFNETEGLVFQNENMSKDYDSFVCIPSSLSSYPVNKSFIKISEPVIIMNPFDNCNMTYLMASDNNPVFVSSRFMVLKINEKIVLPNYLYLLGQKGIINDAIQSGISNEHLKYSDFDGSKYITPTMKFCWIEAMIPIAESLEEQMRQYEESYIMWKALSNKEKALQTLLEKKSWLNEEHIRTIKHRLNDELQPIDNDLHALYDAFEKGKGILDLNKPYGKKSSYKELIDRLLQQIKIVEDTIKDLTRTQRSDNRMPLDLTSFVESYASENQNATTHTVCAEIPNAHIWVSANKEDIDNLFGLIVGNAIRHGFIDSSRSDYEIMIKLSTDQNNNCVLSLFNNGISMTERGERNYFVRGAIGGPTGHSGLGGADIKNIIDSMGGEVVLDNDSTAKYPVCIRISLPILKITNN